MLHEVCVTSTRSTMVKRRKDPHMVFKTSDEIYILARLKGKGDAAARRDAAIRDPRYCQRLVTRLQLHLDPTFKETRGRPTKFTPAVMAEVQMILAEGPRMNTRQLRAAVLESKILQEPLSKRNLWKHLKAHLAQQGYMARCGTEGRIFVIGAQHAHGRLLWGREQLQRQAWRHLERMWFTDVTTILQHPPPKSTWLACST